MPPLPTTWYSTVKHAADFAIAFLLLALSWPVILLCALAVKLTSPGKAIYSQVRLGQNGREFTIHKIRTMRNDAEAHGVAMWSTPGDPRVTPLGRFLRKTHLDELPQLWNVLCGHMSMVGPRPERPKIVQDLQRDVPHYLDRLHVRPGITGLAQVQLPADTDVASVRRKLAYDLYYIRHMGVWLDLRLMACTAIRMIGLPFHVITWLFGLPHQETVEHHYHARRQTPGRVPGSL